MALEGFWYAINMDRIEDDWIIYYYYFDNLIKIEDREYVIAIRVETNMGECSEPELAWDHNLDNKQRAINQVPDSVEKVVLNMLSDPFLEIDCLKYITTIHNTFKEN
jgi:hypothetical protein